MKFIADLELKGIPYPSVFHPISRGGLLVLGSVESLFWMFFLWGYAQVSNEQNPGCLGYKGDYTSQGIIHPCRGSPIKQPV